MISIAVFMYNEEQYIIETLESIKYQIINFGTAQEIQLILSDDCSTDRTVEVAEMWLAENSSLFKEIVRIYGKENVGTCKKYVDVIHSVKGSQYVTIAGDDIFSNQNLFEKIKIAKSKDIMMEGVLLFSNKGINLNKKSYINIVFQSTINNLNVRWNSKFGCPILNGAIYNRHLLSENVLLFMSQFKLVDDRPRVYKIALDNDNLVLGYDNAPILLSRRHDKSASNLNSPHLSVHNADLYNLYTYIIKQESNPFVKLSLIYQRYTVKWRGKGGIFSKLRYFTLYYFTLFMQIIINQKKLSALQAELVDKYADSNSKHLKYIHQQAINFYSKQHITFNEVNG